MAWDQSVVFVCAASDKAAAANLVAMIYGDEPAADEISVPLSASGQAPATHSGAHAQMSEAMVTALNGFKNAEFGSYDLTRYSLTEETARTVAQAMTMDIRSDATGHFDEIIAALGLAVISG